MSRLCLVETDVGGRHAVHFGPGRSGMLDGLRCSKIRAMPKLILTAQVQNGPFLELGRVRKIRRLKVRGPMRRNRRNRTK